MKRSFFILCTFAALALHLPASQANSVITMARSLFEQGKHPSQSNQALVLDASYACAVYGARIDTPSWGVGIELGVFQLTKGQNGLVNQSHYFGNSHQTVSHTENALVLGQSSTGPMYLRANGELLLGEKISSSSMAVLPSISDTTVSVDSYWICKPFRMPDGTAGGWGKPVYVD